MNGLTASLVSDRGAIDSIVPQWTTLLADGAGGGIFSTAEWHLTWLDTIPTVSPRFVVVSDAAGCLRALLPLVLRRRRVGPLDLRALELSGEAIAGGDHLGLIARAADAAGAWTAAASMVRSCAAEADLVRLAAMDPRESSGARAALSSGAGWHAFDSKNDVAPCMTLPADGSDVLDAFRAGRRTKLRYYERHFATSHPSGAIALNDECLPLTAALNALHTLHGSRWQVRGEPGVFADDTFTTFVRRFATLAHERGWLRLYQTIVEGRVVAALLVLHYRGTASAWLLGWDPAFRKWNVPELLFVHSMREAAREGLGRYDFLRGREPYKFRFPVEAPALITAQWSLTRRGRIAMEAAQLGERMLASARRWRTRAARVADNLRHAGA